MNAVGAYIYAGGYSLGVMRKDFKVLAHLEDPKPYGREVIDMNRNYFPAMPIYAGPDWPDIDSVDLLFANPPCAPFSNANTKSFEKDSWRKDERIHCWHNVANYAIRNDIHFVAIETVPQAYSKAPSFLMEKAEEFSFAGYKVCIFLHNAMYHGSCQNRPRLMLIASKYDFIFPTYFDKPEVTVGDKFKEGEGVIGNNNDYFVPCQDAYKPLLEKAYPGERMRDCWERMHPPETRVLNVRGQVKGRPTFGVKRLQLDRQMNTIVGYSTIHPTENRYLTIKEYQILADFPVDYQLPMKSTSMSLIARGISSKVGEWIGEAAKLTLESKLPVTDINLLTIKWGMQGKLNEMNYNIKIEPNSALPDLPLRTKR